MEGVYDALLYSLDIRNNYLLADDKLDEEKKMLLYTSQRNSNFTREKWVKWVKCEQKDEFLLS